MYNLVSCCEQKTEVVDDDDAYAHFFLVLFNLDEPFSFLNLCPPNDQREDPRRSTNIFVFQVLFGSYGPMHIVCIVLASHDTYLTI